MKKELELYIHIPFCEKKCAYCDFPSAPASAEVKMQYVEALLKEIRAFEAPVNVEVVSVFFGGGTPSVLPAEKIGQILTELREKFLFAKETEISLEANPGTVTFEKLTDYRKYGINRLSFGLQSANDEELQKLGRIHDYATFLESYRLARKAGFANLNVDLMSALPGQSVESWEETLRKVLELEPEHISAYSLIIEEGTPFYERYEEDVVLREQGEEPKLLPSEETEREIYRRTEELLGNAGYLHYEISNYAKPGKECRHNIGYWERRDYVGFGLSAASLLHPYRYHNTEDLKEYLEGKFEKKDFEELTQENQMEETMFLGLRMLEGVSKTRFQEQFSCPLADVYQKELKKLKDAGLVEENEEFVRLTKRGIDVSNQVMAEFLL